MVHIHLVTGEHFAVPGLVRKAFATSEKANVEAADLVRIMADDTHGSWGPVTPETWPAVLEKLQDYHGSQYCYVEITELPVED